MKKMMKNLCSVAILLAMVLTMMPVVAFAADGDLTETNGVYEIGNVEQLKTFNTMMAGGNTFEGKIVKLTADIIYNDVSTFADWGTTAPTNSWGVNKTGTTGTPTLFLGTFDGQGHTITGLYISATNGSGTGMFPNLGGTVKNFTLKNAYIEGNSKAYVGSVVGRGYRIAADTDAGTEAIYYPIIIDNVSSDATIVSCGSQGGGILGGSNNCFDKVEISDCSFSGSITSSSDDIGGIIGFAVNASSAKIINCSYVGNIAISGISAKYIGGIVGRNNIALEVFACMNKGNISFETSANTTDTKYTAYGVGGILGYAKGGSTYTIDSCLVNGTLVTKYRLGVGGVVGYSATDTTTVTQSSISNCLIKGTLTSGRSGGYRIGGVIGTMTEASSSIKIDNIIYAMSSDNAGVLGCEKGGWPINSKITVNGYLFDDDVCDLNTAQHGDGSTNGVESTYVTAKTTEQLKSVPTGWTKWIVQDNTYPIPAAIVQANCVELIGYQNYTTAQNGKTSYRFIAVVDELANLGVAGAMDYAGFKVSITVGNNTKTDTVWCNNAYTSLIGGETTYRADQYGGEYFFFFTLTNVPANTTFEITLTPFVGTSSEAADLYEGVAKTLTLTTPAASGSAS